MRRVEARRTPICGDYYGKFELLTALSVTPPVFATTPGERSLLTDDEIRHLVRDGEGYLEAVLLEMRNDLIRGQGEPVCTVGATLSRLSGERARGLQVFATAASQGRVASIIYTTNRILAYSFWQSDFRFAAWDDYLRSLRQGA